MNLKIIKESEIIFNENLNIDLNEKDEEKLSKFDNYECVSYEFKFEKGIMVKQVHDFNEASKYIKEIIINVK